MKITVLIGCTRKCLLNIPDTTRRQKYSDNKEPDQTSRTISVKWLKSIPLLMTLKKSIVVENSIQNRSELGHMSYDELPKKPFLMGLLLLLKECLQLK